MNPDNSKPFLSNYHTHSRYCDGRGEIDDFAGAAIEKNFKYIGFTSHAELPFETTWTMKPGVFPLYRRAVLEAKEKFRETLTIFLGLEADYIPGTSSPVSGAVKSLGLDFVVGSVHFLGDPANSLKWTVDGTRDEFEGGLRHDFGGDIRKLVEQYYERISEMALAHTPDVLGHFDIVKKNNAAGAYFSEGEKWYRDAVAGALEAVRRSGCVMEVNTGGIFRKTSCALYPSEWILAECKKLKIPLTVNSDAHWPEAIDGQYFETFRVMRDAGIESYWQFTGPGWKEESVPSAPGSRDR